MVYVIQVMLTVSITCMTYTIAVCTVRTPDDGQRNCRKHVEFYSKNKFGKLVHLVGFIIRKTRRVWRQTNTIPIFFCVCFSRAYGSGHCDVTQKRSSVLHVNLNHGNPSSTLLVTMITQLWLTDSQRWHIYSSNVYLMTLSFAEH